MSSGSTVVSTQRSQGNCIFLNIKWTLLKGYSLTTSSFLFDIGWGEWGGRIQYFYVSGNIFSLLSIVDQVWLVHDFVASSSSLSPLVAADALEILSPRKGQDTLLPWGHLGFIPRSSKCSSCSWNSVSGRATQCVA